MKCIFCFKKLRNNNLSKEHIIPFALGGTLVLDERVCKICNDRIGHSVDTRLVNHELIKIIRHGLGLISYSKKTPILQYDCYADVPDSFANNTEIPTNGLIPNSTLRSRVKYREAGTIDSLKLLEPYTKHKTLPDGSNSLSIYCDTSESRLYLDKKLKCWALVSK